MRWFLKEQRTTTLKIKSFKKSTNTPKTTLFFVFATVSICSLFAYCAKGEKTFFANDNTLIDDDDTIIYDDDSTEYPSCPHNCYPPIYLFSTSLRFINNKINIIFNRSVEEDRMYANLNSGQYLFENISPIHSKYGLPWGSDNYNSNIQNLLFEGVDHQPLVIYGDSDILKMSIKSDLGWTITSIPDSEIRWAPFDATIDSSGAIHITMLKPDNSNPETAFYQIVYLTNRGKSWTSETISENTFTQIAITVDHIGDPHIFYHDDAEGALIEKHPSSEGWTSRKVAIGEAGKGSLSGIGFLNSLGIAYATTDQQNRYYCYGQATDIDGDWSTECPVKYTIPQDWTWDGYVRLIINSQNQPIFGFGLPGTTNDIGIATKTDTWSIEYLHEMYKIETDLYFSMSMVAGDNIALSYYINKGDPFNGDLMYVTLDSNHNISKQIIYREPVCRCEGS